LYSLSHKFFFHQMSLPLNPQPLFSQKHTTPAKIKFHSSPSKKIKKTTDKAHYTNLKKKKLIQISKPPK
ncbi:hypothetical protein, partial [Leptospira borgpetersenii]|uniref:hypothetical protein n=1 Tax=Leptospira borgpetersenii TaxID=174 RepID=UPI0027DB3F45